MNNCSFFPDLTAKISDCCAQHDEDYGQYGTVSRREADRFLRECVTAAGHPAAAWVMWVGVRLAGWLFWKKKRPLAP